MIQSTQLSSIIPSQSLVDQNSRRSTTSLLQKNSAKIYAFAFLAFAIIAVSYLPTAQAVDKCEKIRDDCILKVMEEKTWLPDDANKKGWMAVACHAGFLICKLLK